MSGFGRGAVALLAAVLGSGQAAAQCQAVSAAQRLPVVELFTSEGCSSCPPADRWLSSLKRAAAQGRVLPLAFHVDYWDYIGWKDAFAQAEFSRRQRNLAQRSGSRTVYTPQVLVDGRDFRAWSNAGDFAGALASASRGPAAARLELSQLGHPPANWRVRLRAALDASAQPHGAFVHLAIVENSLQSSVRAGENAGATLRHDFVVRRWLGPFRVPEKGVLETDIGIDLAPGWKVPDLSVAAIAYSDRNGDILQAVSLPACPTNS